MVNPTYKHLEDRIRIGAFSVGQWLQILLCGGLALAFGVYLSPLSPSSTMFVSVVMAGLPVALSYGAMGLDFSVAELAGAALRYYARPRRYVPGAGAPRPGYLVDEPSTDPTADAPELVDGSADLGDLWSY